MSNSPKKRTKGEHWTHEEILCFLKLCLEKEILKVMDGKKVRHADVYKELELPMKENGYIKSGQQMRTKLKHLKEDYYNTKRNNDKSGRSRKIAPYMEELNLLFSCRPKNIANLYGGSGVDPDAEQYENSIIKENTIAKEMDYSEPNMIEEVELIFPEELEENQFKKKNKNVGRTSNAKILDLQSQLQKDMLNDVLERQQSFMTQVMETQRQLDLEMQAKDHEHQISQTKILMDGFLSGLKLIIKESKN